MLVEAIDNTPESVITSKKHKELRETKNCVFWLPRPRVHPKRAVEQQQRSHCPSLHHHSPQHQPLPHHSWSTSGTSRC